MSELMLAEEREALSLRVTDARTQSVPQSLVVEDTLPDEHPPWLAKLDARAKKELVDIVDELVRVRQQPERRWFISSAFTRWRHFILEMREHDVALCTRTTVKYLLAQVHKNTKKVTRTLKTAAMLTGLVVLSAASPAPTPKPIEGEECSGEWLNDGELSQIPDIAGTPVKVEGATIPYLLFAKDESRHFCAKIKALPGRTISKVKFEASELHNHTGCAGLLLSATPRQGPLAGQTRYTADPIDGFFYRHVNIRYDGADAAEVIYDLVLEDRSFLYDVDEDGRVEGGVQLHQGGDQCTSFEIKFIIFYND